MVIDAGGAGSMMDGFASAQMFTPPSFNFMETLSNAGRQMWDKTTAVATEFAQRLTGIAGMKQLLLQQGAQRDDFAIYLVNNRDSFFNATGITRDYMMSHPTMVRELSNGADIYDEYVLPQHHHVLYGRVMDGMVQVDREHMVYVDEFTDYGYSDIPLLTDQQQYTMINTYKYLEDHIVGQLDNLIMDTYSE